MLNSGEKAACQMDWFLVWSKELRGVLISTGNGLDNLETVFWSTGLPDGLCWWCMACWTGVSDVVDVEVSGAGGGRCDGLV